MVQVQHGFFRYRAFWMTAGLTAGAATWALAIEPIGTPVLLQPVPPSNVVQIQAQTAPAQPLRTQQPGAVPIAVSPQQGVPKSAVQQKLEELYQQDGRQMPDLPDPQIPRQTPGQTGTAAPPLPPAQQGALPTSTGVTARPISSTTAQPVRSSAPVSQQAPQTQYDARAQGQVAGTPRSTPAKRTPWLEQINPFKKRVSAAPPTEPAEIQYDPRHAAGQSAQPPSMQAVGQPALQPGQVNPQTGRQNYGQLFAQPQTFGAAAPQGDPFVNSTPMAVAATPQLTPAATPVPAQSASVAPSPSFAPPVPLQAASPHSVPQVPTANVPQAAPSATPAPATAVANLPVLDFSAPVPVNAGPAQNSAAATAAAPVRPEPAPVAQLPLVLPQNPPSAAGPQNPLPQSTPAVGTPALAGTSPEGADSPFTGLGLNDSVPTGTPPVVAIAPVTQPAPTTAAPATAVPATSLPLQVAEAPMPPAVPAAPAPAGAPQTLPKLDGFFSAEEERRSDQPVAKLPEQPRTLVVPTPPPSSEAPAVELSKPAAVAPLVVVQPSLPDVPPPADVASKAPAELPKLEFPAVAATPPEATVQPITVPPLKPVPRQTDGAAASKMALIAARADQRGLKGFCPVMLRDHRELVDAKPEYRSFYHNRIILLSSAEAKSVFESDPSKYAPAASGNDVIHFAQTGEELEGSLEHAVWYKGRLYMFQSAETMETFVAAPSSHATND